MGDFIERRKEDPRINQLVDDVRELKDAFNKIQGAIIFVKWMAAIIAAAGATWAWIVAQINITYKG